MEDFWNDVQALLGRGFINRRHSVHMLMKVSDLDAARAWFAAGSPTRSIHLAATPDVKGRIDDRDDNGEPFYQVAFTPAGLKAFEAPECVMAQFPDPFLSGMSPEPADGAVASRRAGILGDVGDNHQSRWLWGGHERGVLWGDIHLLLMIFANDAEIVEAERDKIIADSGLVLAGPENVAALETALYMDDLDDNHPKEHFGFLDGVSQPLIKGLRAAETIRGEALETYERHAVSSGEFVLGQMNEREIVTPYPDIAEFGKNGSFLVIRQMEQHVSAFNELVEETAKALVGERTISISDKELASAKLMGRYRNGWPLSPKHGAPAEDEEGALVRPLNKKSRFLNDFGFAERDAGGLSCPLSSHIRRANPRDSREDPPETAQRLSKRHRILRRGRVYGPSPANDHFTVEDGDEARGLLFVCLNADIAQQFEFIQQTWLNNHFFAGVNGEVDPVTTGLEDDESAYTIPGRPNSAEIQRSKPLTTIRGGGYFFLPGKAAVEQLMRGVWPCSVSGEPK